LPLKRQARRGLKESGLNSNRLITQYLAAYIALRRVVAVATAIGWAVVFAMLWLMLLCGLDRWLMLAGWIRCGGAIIGGLVVLAIVARPLSFLFRRRNFVAAAIEIEKLEPAFDQRLITVASEQTDAQLLQHLQVEVQTVIAGRRGSSLVSFRPLVWPMIITTGSIVVIVFLLHSTQIDLSHLFRRMYPDLP
jgi:hypothetical protein